MARIKNASDFAKKYVRRATQAVQDYKDGIASVTEAPGVKAAAKADKYINGVNTAFAEGRWQRNTAAVPLQTWKEVTDKKGGANYSTGVAAAESRVMAFAQDLLAFQSQLKAELATMDDSTPEARMQRMIWWSQRMSEFRTARRRGQ